MLPLAKLHVKRGPIPDVPGAHPRPRWPGCSDGGGASLGCRFSREQHAQAFPSFGSERMGAPVVSFCRIDDKEIRLREPILEPDALIVQDPTLFKAIDVCQGLKPTGYLLVNSNRALSELHLDADRQAIARGARIDRAGIRARAQACRAPAAQCRFARRLRPAHWHRPVEIGHRRDPRGISRQRSRRRISPPPPPRMTLSPPAAAA